MMIDQMVWIGQYDPSKVQASSVNEVGFLGPITLVKLWPDSFLTLGLWVNIFGTENQKSLIAQP